MLHNHTIDHFFKVVPTANQVLNRALSNHGRSYSYDEKATGFGRGEGAACMLIKRMDDAIRDGDPIHAVIRSTACNHSGRSGGITMPSGLAQEKLLWAVHDAAGLDPSETPVVEVCPGRWFSLWNRTKYSPSSISGPRYWHRSWRPNRSRSLHACSCKTSNGG